MATLLPDLLFETSGQAPAPAKDFYQIAITKTEVIWRWWKISLRLKQGTMPGEMKQSHDDFLHDARLHYQVGLVFGSQILEYTLGLCEGRFDYLERLSDNLLLKVLSYLSYQDICLLSQTSRRFRKLCDSKELWEQRCGDALTPDIEMLANRFGWKRVYATLYQSEAQPGSEADSPMGMNEDEEQRQTA